MGLIALGAATHVLAVDVVMPWWGPAALHSGKGLLRSERMQSSTELMFSAEVSHTLCQCDHAVRGHLHPQIRVVCVLPRSALQCRC